MRCSILVAIAAIISVEPAVAAPTDQDVEQMLRAASRLQAVATVCPALIPTDAKRARAYATVYLETVEKFAKDRVEAMMPDEIKRRIAEVEITGEQRWCEDQRRFMKEVGAGEIFPTARNPSRR